MGALLCNMQEYESLVKQHVDLQTIEARLRQGSYSSSTAKFSRDLLLLLTNFIVFFPKSSPESTAAHEMRRLVSHYQLEKQTPASSETLPPPLPPPQPDAPANPDSLLAKDKPPAAPMIVCRKRSSLSVAKKAETQSDDKKLAAVDARPSARPSRRLSSIEDKEKEAAAAAAAMTGIRSSRRSTKNSPAAAATTADDSPAKKQASSHTDGASKAEKTKAASTGPSRKRGAAVDFLERIKLNSSPTGKNDSGGGGGKAEPQKARGGGKNGGNAQQGGDQKGDGGSLLRSGGGKQAKEEESLARRSNARRPLKKVADLTSKRKRAVEGEEEEAAPAGKETAVASNRRRKRVRR